MAAYYLIARISILLQSFFSSVQEASISFPIRVLSASDWHATRCFEMLLGFLAAPLQSSHAERCRRRGNSYEDPTKPADLCRIQTRCINPADDSSR